MKKTFLICFLCLCSSLLFGQTPNTQIIDDDSIVYIVDTINVKIHGGTQKQVLLDVLDLHENKKIVGTLAWTRFIQLKRVTLADQRIFSSAQLDVKLKEVDQVRRAYITISVTDGRSIIGMPYPKYSSDSGLTIALKLRDYNFLGTMQPFRLDLNFINNQYGHKGYGFSNDGDIPFQFLENSWDFDYSQDLKIVQTEDNYYEGKLGLSFKKMLGESALTLRTYQGVDINNEASDDIIHDWNYLTSGASISTSNPLGINVGPFGELYYYNSVNLEKTYRPDNELLNDDQRHFNLWYNHGFTFGKINWDGNFRKGWKVDVNNNLGKKLDSLQAKTIPYFKTLDFTNTIATNWGWGGFTTRFSAFYQFDETRDKVGSYLRGIIDDRINADYGVVANFDLPIRIINFKPSEWFAKHDYKLFDFEMMLAPFVDVGSFGYRYNHVGVQHGWEGPPWVGSGIEVFVFPSISKSFFIRASYGVEVWSAWRTGTTSGYSVRKDDLYAADNSNVKIREIALQMGFFY